MQQLTNYPDVLNVSDVQNILGIGRNKAYKLTLSGAFHIVRIGNLIKIPKASFLNWLNGDH